MKSFRTYAILLLCTGFLFTLTSCAVFITPSNERHSVEKKDNGNHYGWFKNPKNPHNPYNTKHENEKDNHTK